MTINIYSYDTFWLNLSELIACRQLKVQEIVLLNLQFFSLVEIILYFVFAGCIFILFSFAHIDTASMSGLIFSSTSAKVGADA